MQLEHDDSLPKVIRILITGTRALKVRTHVLAADVSMVAAAAAGPAGGRVTTGLQVVQASVRKVLSTTEQRL